MEPRPSPVMQPPVYVAGSALISPRLPLLEAARVAREAGADGFEVPSGLVPLAMNPDEMPPLLETLAGFPAPPALAMREPLFRAGQPQTELLQPALLEATSLGCGVIVFPLGELRQVDDSLRPLAETLATLGARAPSVRFLVANDATPGKTDLASWSALLEQAATWSHPLGMSFDLAHWTCTGEDAVEAAQKLGRFVGFVRVARATFENGVCVAQPIHPAESVFPALRSLPAGAPRAVAFPIPAPDRQELATLLREQLTRLRTGMFTV